MLEGGGAWLRLLFLQGSVLKHIVFNNKIVQGPTHCMRAWPYGERPLTILVEVVVYLMSTLSPLQVEEIF